MLLLFRRNLEPAVTLALCVSWNLGSHSWSQYQPIIRNKCRDTCFQLCNPEVFNNWANNIKSFHILWRKNHDHKYVLNFKCISSPTTCGIKATGGSKCDCSDRFGLQVMKIFWEDFVEWFYMLKHPNSTQHITFFDIKIYNLKYLFLKQWLQKRAN